MSSGVCINNTYRVISASWGGAYEDPVGFGIQRRILFAESLPADNLVSLKAIQSISHEATVKFQGLATPKTPTAAAATLQIVLQKMGQGATTKTITGNNFRPGDMDMSGENTGTPHVQEDKFVHDPQATVETNPISVT